MSGNNKDQDRFEREYLRILESTDVSERFDDLLDRISISSSSRTDSRSNVIELVFTPFEEAFEEEPSWAAATELPREDPLRFCSHDGRYTLREFRDPAGGQSSFRLADEHGGAAGRFILEIDGVRVEAGESGLVEIPGGEPGITAGSRIVILQG